MDTMLQISILAQPGRSLRLPTRIQSVRIDPSIHKEKIISTETGKSGEVINLRDQFRLALMISDKL